MSYHGKESVTQTPEVARLQEKSMEIWGREPRGSSILKVQAFKKKLPLRARGVEFDSYVVPDPDGHPHIASWSGKRSGILSRNSGDTNFIAIKVIKFVNKQPLKGE